MSIVQISRILQRRGPLADLPKGTPENPIGLRDGEIGLASDTGAVFIGTPNLLQVESRKPGVVDDGQVENEKGQTRTGRFPYANTQLLTEWTRNTEELIKYVYRFRDTETNNEFPGPGSGLEWTYDQARPWDENNEIVSRNLQERLDEYVSVKSYGAKGDGVTDDTYAIWRAAVDVVRIDPIQYNDGNKKKTSSRRVLYFPAGIYKTSRPIILPPYSTWVGDGIGKTIIKLVAESTDFKIRCVLETVDDGYCSADGLEELQVCWSTASNESNQQVLIRTEYNIGTATTVSSGLYGAELPNNISVSNMTLQHAGHINNAAPARDIVRLNRSSKTRWYNVRFEGNNFLKTDYYTYDYRKTISNVLITNSGSGYTTTPLATITGGGGSGAIVDASINGIIAINIPSGGIGDGYSIPPSVIISDPTGTGCKAIANVNGGKIITITIEKTGKNYTNPTISFFGGGPAARDAIGAIAIIGTGKVTEVEIINPGQGYGVGTEINFESVSFVSYGYPITKAEIFPSIDNGYGSLGVTGHVNFTLQGSQDNTLWTDIGTNQIDNTTLSASPGISTTIISSDINTIWKYIRVKIDVTTGSNLGCSEVKFYTTDDILILHDTGTNIGDLTLAGGLTAAFDNNSIDSYATCAQSTDGSGSGYIGKDYSFVNPISSGGIGASAVVITADMPYDVIVKDNTGLAMYNNGSENPQDADSIGVFIDGLGGLTDGTIVNPVEHIFVGCQFAKTTYGLSITDQVKQVSLIGCSFEEHYRGINLGEDLWWHDTEVDDTNNNLPLSGLLSSLEVITNIQFDINGVYRIKLKSNGKIYKVIMTDNPLGDTYSLIEIKTWGLHTNGDEGDRSLPGQHNGPSDIKISNCYFNKIIDSGIFVGKGSSIISSGNTFEYTVGRGENYSGNTKLKPLIYFGSSATHCSSIGDWFGRNEQDNNRGISGGRIVYNPFLSHMVITAQETPTIPYLTTKIMKTTLGTTDQLTSRPTDNSDNYYPSTLPVLINSEFPTPLQLATEFKHTGIELSISDYFDIGSTMTEQKDLEGFVIEYTLSNDTVRAIGQMYITAQFIPDPGTSIVTLKDHKMVSMGDTQVRFIAQIIKYTNEKSFVKILYNNSNGTSINMTYSIRRWRL